MLPIVRSASQAGYLLGRYPCYRFGNGATPLVVLPGLNDAFSPLGVSRVQTLAFRYYYFRRFTEEFTVYVLGRPHGLPAGYSTREMAVEYNAAIDALGFDSVACLSISMGGLIAQYLAAEFECIDRLVCSVAGCRLGEHGKRVVRRWRDLASQGEWFEAVIDEAARSYTGSRRWLYPPALRLTRPFFPDPASEADAVTAAEACLAHDFTESLGEIDVPTLVIGGREDRLFPATIVEETAAGIPDGRCRLVSGVGHGGYEERPEAWNETIRRFLDG